MAVDLHITIGARDRTFASGVSPDGTAQVGFAEQEEYRGDVNQHAVVWHGTARSLVDLHPAHLGFDSSSASAAAGGRQVGVATVLGRPGIEMNHPDQYRHAILWSGTAGSAVDLHPAHLFPRATRSSSWSNGIASNQQVGAGLAAGGPAHALLWRGTAESAVDLHPPGFASSWAAGTDGEQQAGFGRLADVPQSESHALYGAAPPRARWTCTPPAGPEHW